VLKIKNKKKTTDIHNKQLVFPCNSIIRIIIIMEAVSFSVGVGTEPLYINRKHFML